MTDTPGSHADAAAPTVLTLTLNPAIDVTYTVPELHVGGTTRVPAPERRAGGKGLNVSRVAVQTGAKSQALARIGAEDGPFFRDELEAAGIGATLIPHPGVTRSTVAIVEQENGRTTIMNEPGADIDSIQWRAVAEALVENLDGARTSGATVLVVSGSLPHGLPADFIPGIIQLAAGANVPTIIDTSGDALLRARGASLIKPNAEELLAATGARTLDEGIDRCFANGIDAVLLSMGEDGLRLYRSGNSGYVAGRLAEPLSGNPTGAGDAAVAAAAQVLATGGSDEELVRRACAYSAAAVLAPLAGDVDSSWPEIYENVILTTQERGNP